MKSDPWMKGNKKIEPYNCLIYCLERVSWKIQAEWCDVAENPAIMAKVHRTEFQREENCPKAEYQRFVEGLLDY